MNHLGAETSPYLRQHSDNPVDWYPWEDEAFRVARESDRPVLLSVGYSACHWCHVMAHESFEDAGTAQVMNRGFVCIKVDREERPDVDAVYMEAVQALSGRGGWPMTVVCLPDGRPFFAGTYYPRAQFVALLQEVERRWHDSRGRLVRDAERLAEAVRSGVSLPTQTWAAAGDPAAASSPELLAGAARDLLARLDPVWGGFGQAPKFPQAALVELLLRAGWATGREDALAGARTTLDAMATGGIYDHLGGGFARYSTDRQWLVPHFEKMLYDNALLARLYLHAWQATGEPAYAQVTAETLDYLLRLPIRLAGAGFASAEDADSEGEEGRFYVWGLDEVVGVGGEEVADWYGVAERGNWEGRNILRRPLRGPLLRPKHVEGGRAALLARRETRVRPGLDDKVLTEWNAMAVAALAEAGPALDRPDWTRAAAEVADFLLASLRRPDGRWLRAWSKRGGAGRLLAYAADYAWLI
ncbi:MAG: thioredoxin domain-containing protein, partial [Acidimicrobiales bacterium]